VRCDVADADSAVAALAEARATHGPARILVNCAGIGPTKRIVGRDGPMPLKDFERVIAININLVGTFNMLRLAAADMQGLVPLADDERGVIVSTASVAACEGQIGQVAYAASKGGVAALTMPAARELSNSASAFSPLRRAFSQRRCCARCRPMFGRASPRWYRSQNCSADGNNTLISRCTACATPISTARSSASTAHCAWRRGDLDRRHPNHFDDGGDRTLAMLTVRRTVCIAWGDCDPAGIVFYPRYFDLFDACTTDLFSQALGMSKCQVLKVYDFG